MALTVAREIALYYILECPYSTQVNEVYGEGLIAETRSVAGSIRAVRTLITNYLTNFVYATAAVETELTTLLDAWIATGTDMSTLENGAIGNIQGISDSAAAERAEIASRVRCIVPFWRYYEQMLTKGAGGGGAGTFVPIVR